MILNCIPRKWGTVDKSKCVTMKANDQKQKAKKRDKYKNFIVDKNTFWNKILFSLSIVLCNEVKLAAKTSWFLAVQIP